MTILLLQCTNSYWVTTPSFTQRRWQPCWELRSFCCDSQLTSRILPGAWHTLLGDVRAVFPQRQGQSYHTQMETSWLSSLEQGSPWNPKEKQKWSSLATAHNVMVEIHQGRIVRSWPTVQEPKECMLCKVGGICLHAMQSLFVLTRRIERVFFFFLVIWAQLCYHAWRTDLKRIRIRFLNTHNIKLFSFSIVI